MGAGCCARHGSPPAASGDGGGGGGGGGGGDGGVDGDGADDALQSRRGGRGGYTSGAHHSGVIVLRLLLTLEASEHEQFIRCATHGERNKAYLEHFDNLRVIQQHLIRSCSASHDAADGGLGASAGGGEEQNAPSQMQVQRVKMNIHSFTESIDALHTAVLERIDGLVRTATESDERISASTPSKVAVRAATAAAVSAAAAAGAASAAAERSGRRQCV